MLNKEKVLIYLENTYIQFIQHSTFNFKDYSFQKKVIKVKNDHAWLIQTDVNLLFAKDIRIIS